MNFEYVENVYTCSHLRLPTYLYTYSYIHTTQKQPKEGGAPKPPRASRSDLSHLTEKEKEDRHREQSRLNGQTKRDQLKVMKTRLRKEVEQMRTYQEALDMAPFVMVVLSAAIDDCRVLYVSKPVTEKLGYEVDKLLGR